jgi:hypothetical protein
MIANLNSPHTIARVVYNTADCGNVYGVGIEINHPFARYAFRGTSYQVAALAALKFLKGFGK